MSDETNKSRVKSVWILKKNPDFGSYACWPWRLCWLCFMLDCGTFLWQSLHYFYHKFDQYELFSFSMQISSIFSHMILCYFHVTKSFKEMIYRDVTGTLDYKESVSQRIRFILTSGSLQQQRCRKVYKCITRQISWLYERSLFRIGNITNVLCNISYYRCCYHHLQTVLFYSYIIGILQKHAKHIDQKRYRMLKYMAS